MMRNVALGAVIGFGVMVLLLSLVGREAPPKLPPPPAEVVDAGSPVAAPAPVGVARPAMMAVPTMRTPRINTNMFFNPRLYGDAGSSGAGESDAGP